MRIPRRVVLCAAVASAALFAQSTAGSRSAVRADPLQGTWESKSVSTGTMRQLLVRSGSTDAQVASFFKFFGMRKAWRNRLVFYRENGVRFLAMSGWDPSVHPGPSEPDHGPYTLLSNHRFVARGVDPPTDRVRMLFSYSATGDRLALRFISLKEPYPAFSRVDITRDTMLMRIVAAAPYRRAG